MKILTYVSRKEARAAKRNILEPIKKIENSFPMPELFACELRKITDEAKRALS
jgi:hypothetical protein